MISIPFISDLLETIHEAVEKDGDPRTRYTFMLWGSPVYVWILSIAYLALVFLGPKCMRNRKAFGLKEFMILYNFAMVILSLYMTIEFYLSTSVAGYSWLCAPFNKDTWKNPLEDRVAYVHCVYGISKTVELLDTVMMILRKKNDQISFLHVFHHGVMVNIWWFVPVFIPGGNTWFGAWVNSLIHVVMYLYYLLACFPSLRGKLWWKKYLTKLQLLQFCVTLTHTIQTYTSGCDFPLWGIVVLFCLMASLMILFGNFYVQTYLKERQRKIERTTREHNGHSAANGSVSSTAHTNGTTVTNSNGITRESLRRRP